MLTLKANAIASLSVSDGKAFLTQTVNSFCEILPELLSSIDRKYFFALALLLTCPRISISSWSYLVVWMSGLWSRPFLP